MLVLYDTTNYEDHPIGGELTSVRNFLRFWLRRNPGLPGARCWWV